jgi:hypothetical protein
MGNDGSPLCGKTILVVEDEYLVGVDLCSILEESGAVIVGPIGCPSQSYRLAISNNVAAW